VELTDYPPFGKYYYILGIKFKTRKKRQDLYTLSANVYRTLGKPDGYIRQAGFDAIQQEQMVIYFARENKNITRREAAFLCQINENQASHLLRKLEKNGKLKMIGGGCGAFYTLP
jgi:ATP-dependent DNA helicase RecG